MRLENDRFHVLFSQFLALKDVQRTNSEKQRCMGGKEKELAGKGDANDPSNRRLRSPIPSVAVHRRNLFRHGRDYLGQSC